MLSRWLEVETHAAPPVAAGEYRITPLAQSWRLKLPFPRIGGGVIWNRPVAVVVQTPQGGERVLEVRDTTRQAQAGLLGVSAAVVLFAWLVSRWINGNRNSEKELKNE